MGKKRVTIKDVAREANVSIATVSNVINNVNKASLETKQKVEEAIGRLNYQPDLSARSLVKKKSNLIGVMLPVLDKKTEVSPLILQENPFYSGFLTGLEYETRKNGYEILLTACRDEKEVVDIARRRNLDGIIYLGTYPQKVYTYMQKLNIPVSLIDTYDQIDYFNNIAIEDETGGYLATKYLIEKGHKNIGILCGDIETQGLIKRRFEGYKRALEETGISFCKDLCFIDAATFQGGYGQTDNILSCIDKVTAVFAVTDVMAVGLIRGFRDRGMIVPDHLSVIGFDDLDMCKYIDPPLTTVRQDIFLKGKMAVQELLKEIEGAPIPHKGRVVLPIQVVERKSVKKL